MSKTTRWVLLVVLVLALLVGGGVALRALGKSEAARRLQLIPAARDAIDALRSQLAGEGIETFIGSTLRTPDEQATKVAVGVSATSSSWHLLGRAVDLYPTDPDTGKPDLDGKHVDRFRRMHELATMHGLQGLAFNSDGTKRYITTKAGKVWDAGHLEYRSGLTFAAAKARFDASGGIS